ncbi:MAG: SDR family NAD(P)-dependent oxidoreductase [Planctomycetes bacterium]|nr:SDR family NAD(P)-dependent oxidoreductase [Planctomycetota bacterium]
MKTLITGAAGFIGSHLAEALVAEGREVLALDDLSTGNMENLRGLNGHERFRFVEGDVRDRALVATLVRDCAEVYHLAAAVGAALVMQQPVRTLEVNVAGTASVLAAATQAEARVFLASTSEVYGRSSAAVQHEEDDLGFGPSTRPRWGYACSKALDEWLALAHASEDGLQVVVGRIFNTTGPRQSGRYGMVLPRFVQAALHAEPLVVHGDGLQTRCFSHVKDTVRAICRLMQTPAAYRQVVNIGSTEEVTIRELAERVVRIAKSSSPIVHWPVEQAFSEGYEDLPRRRPCTKKLRALTGFTPAIPLDEIIAALCHEGARG